MTESVFEWSDRVGVPRRHGADWLMLHGDSYELLPTLPQGCADAVITDPPYALPAQHYISDVRWARKWSDVSILERWWGEVCDRIKRPLRSDGSIVVFVNGTSYPAFFPSIFERWDQVRSLVWYKPEQGTIGAGTFSFNHELMIFGRARAPLWEPKGVKRDVLVYHKVPGRDRKHPVEKPADLLGELVDATCPPGGVVLDPFAGGGSTGLGCCVAGRRFIGIEKDPAYFELCAERLESATRGRSPLPVSTHGQRDLF